MTDPRLRDWCRALVRFALCECPACAEEVLRQAPQSADVLAKGTSRRYTRDQKARMQVEFDAVLHRALELVEPRGTA